MSSDKPFPERFKKFMKSDMKNLKSLPEIKITQEIISSLCQNSALNIRLEIMKDLEEQYKTVWLEEGAIEKIWNCIKDLVQLDKPSEQRHIALNFMGATITNSGIDRLGVNRMIFITHIFEVYKHEDIYILFDFFCVIVENGRHIEHVEGLIDILISEWILHRLMREFPNRDIIINFLTTLMKFNASHIEDFVIENLVSTISDLLLNVRNKEELLACNAFLNTIICYVYIPAGTLYDFIYSLTLQASMPDMIDQVWKIVQNLLRTEVGVTGLHYLRCIIEKADYRPEQFHFIRGAIFFLARALWSEHRILTLSYSPMPVLKTFKCASRHKHPLVHYEMAISLSFLVRNCAADLHMSSWDLLLENLGQLLHFTANHNVKEHAKMMFNVMNTVMDHIEDKILHETFTGTLSTYYDLVDKFSEIRQEPSVLLMLDYKFRRSVPHDPLWLNHLLILTRKHFSRESKTAIRLKVLSNLKYIFDKFTRKDAFDICNVIILNQLNELNKDDNLMVRKMAICLLVHMILHLRSPIITSMLQFIEKVVLGPYTQICSVDYIKADDVADVYEGIKGLILIFKNKIWCLPSSHAIQAYQILMSSVELHYRNTQILEQMSHIRKLVFDMIFEMRADARYHLGLPNCPDALLPPSGDEELDKMLPKYTSYIIVDHKHGQKPKSSFFFFPDDGDASSTSSLSESSDDLDDDFQFSSMTRKKKKEFDPERDAMKDYDKCVYPKKPVQDNFASLLDEIAKSSVSVQLEALSICSGNSAEGDFPLLKEEKESQPVIYSYEEDKIYSTDFDVNNMEPATEVAHLSLTQAARLVIVAMKKEKDWSLLKTILERIPQVLQNKALILSKDGNDVDYLATTLCYLVTDKDTNSFYNTPSKFAKSDFHNYVFPVMATLASYHQNLKVMFQINVIRCLRKCGMFSKKSSPMCVSALTICVLEMTTAMTKELKEVIFSLSKISATVQNAQPTLEFLSTVLHLPRIYADFNRMQTFTVIAICTPYTNPFKFNAYVVSLAYHVINMWFLKCRKNYRQHFVRYISKNLYMILLNEGSAKRVQSMIAQEQALEEARARTTRTRSFSTHSTAEMTNIKLDRGKPLDLKKKDDEDMVQFHRDLHEICVDFMARNCFEVNSPSIRRSGTCDMLLKDGLTRTWLQGTRIITITTSGCYDQPFKRGMCDQCCKRCHIDDESINERKSSHDQSESSRRRRHKSDFHRTVSHEAKIPPQTSKDDIYMRPLSKDSSQSTSTDPEDVDDEDYVCACWCRGWAEVIIRQPTGNDCFMMRFQNKINNIKKEDMIPVNELSSFYVSSLTPSLPAEEIPSSPSDREAYNYGQLPEDIRPRAHSGASEKTQASEWSNSASGPSSGAASLASSDIKLDAKAEPDNSGEPPHVPVHHCRSNPEVNKGPEPSVVECRIDSKSLVEGAPVTAVEKGKNKLVSICPRSMSSPSPPPNMDEMQRVRHYSAMQMKSSTSCAAVCEKEEDSNLLPMKRDRGHTISDMNPVSRNSSLKGLRAARKPTLAETSSSPSLPSEDGSKQKEKPERPPGLTPSAVFLQMFYQPILRDGCFKPIWVPPELDSSLRLLDRISALEHHKLGVIYVGPGQKTEAQILRNTSGTQRYYNFLDGLGTVFELDELHPNTNLGGLDKRGVDGNLIYMWNDDLMQVIFHVATSMPNKSSDPNCNNKKRHIGNDCVNIVYNNSGGPYSLDTIKSQFNHAVVEIVPGDHSTNTVRLLVKAELSKFVSWDRDDTVRLVSDVSLPVLGRQMALHANLASTVWESLKKSNHLPYASNWMERLRKIRAIREKIVGKEEADRNLLEMQERQYPSDDYLNRVNDDKYYSNLDFADWIDVDKQEIKHARSSTAFFVHKNRPFFD